VVTSKVSWGATDELDEAGLLPYFAAVVGFDDTDQHKPDPQPVYAALERLFVDAPEEALFVGDSPADIFASRNAGCVGVGALWGTLDRELLLDASPDHTAGAPGEVLAIVAALANGRAR
jgi:pyrophosphatase PpaX